MVFKYDTCRKCGKGIMLPTEKSCQTPAGFGHVYKCTECGYEEDHTEAVYL